MFYNKEKITKTEKITCDSPNFEPIRIDKFLFEKFPDFSRAYFQKLIDFGMILVNSKTVNKSNYKLKKNDALEVNFPEEKQFDLKPRKVDFEIVDIQPEFIVINKPAGLVVHPSQKTQVDETTLINGLLYQFQELKQFENSERPGIVHRLDKGTSGLLLIARNPKALIKFSDMFKNREVKKTYLAVVKGHPPKTGKIDYAIGRHPFKSHKMSHMGYHAKKALTYYEVLAYYKDCALVEVKIVTGRTHQIRVHFSAIGHKLLGDDIYGCKSEFIERPALHAWKLSFEFKEQKFKYLKQIPDDIKNLLKNLNNPK